MPRGQSKQTMIFSSELSSKLNTSANSRAGSGHGVALVAASPEEQRSAIVCSVEGFAQAWFMGDSAAMVRCLHPDYVHRLVAIDGRGEPAPDLVSSALGVQGRFGRLTPQARRCQEVRILDVRRHSASAVAILGDWILQVHLARSGGHWCIVNVMWELNH